MAEQRLNPQDQRRLTALFDELYEPMRQFVSRLGKESGKDLSSDRDIVMGAFKAAIEAWQSFGTWDAQRQKAWLITVCRNKRVDEIRRQSCLRALVEQVWTADRPDESPEHVALNRLALARCVAVLRSMPPVRRDVATMAWLLQMPTSEIAVELGMRPGTVRVHLSHARRILREEVGPYLSFQVDGDDEPERRQA
ncbi:RNA polymerase sigma factor [Streptomyces sp. SP2-10]|uniref:RNA polymerase sigma factor n=1 Tax=Streptomyces sp. SP2-10 TaxID=2873385 RepID=UPI001CA7059E|nr:sigma-70 family RNA polymerase sigma factor [Streptomyces sp. SP2-10]MBY8846874.1 sigma-70 family RNA polymerase sigma factor [Streptomyces sp. SP2-10]